MSANVVKLFSAKIVPHTGRSCTASVILLHGSGGTGADLHSTFKFLLRQELTFPHIRIIYPTAPERPYTLSGGFPSNVWFDRLSLGLQGPEDVNSVNNMATQLTELIYQEVNSGIPLNRIVLGGFSMGGCMALHLGYRFHRQVAGVLAMSSFLSNDSVVYQALKESEKGSHFPQLRHFHGEMDDLVEYSWGKETYTQLTSLGVPGEFVTLPGLYHSINSTIAQSVRDWIVELLPDV